MATGLLVMSLPFEGFLNIEDNDAGSKLPDEFSEFFPVLTMELVGTLFVYLAFLFIHSPESKYFLTLILFKLDVFICFTNFSSGIYQN